MKKLISILLLGLQLLIYQQSQAATNSDYTCKPPYLSLTAKPNINLVLDYSGSMNWLAYVSCDVSTSGSVSNCTAYDSTKNYDGYFKSDFYYKYNSSGYWEENSACSTTNRMGTISSGCLSGNLLNYATTTRINVLRKILTGGRFVTSTNIYIDEGDGRLYGVDGPGTFTDSATNCKFTISPAGSATPSTARTIKMENNTTSSATMTGVAITVSATNKTFSVQRPSRFNGFKVGDIITTSGFTNAGNNGTFTITSISRNRRIITCSAASGLVSATSGTSAIITTGSSGSCVLLGTASSSATYQINNKTTTPAEVTGVLQGVYPEKTDLELSLFSGALEVTYKTGKNKLLSDYLSVINTTSPGGGTNTGPALSDARNYFAQTNMTQSSSSIDSANNTLMISKKDAGKDPYYDINSPSTLPALPAPCRQSFVLLISDGQWNSGVDPVIPAYYMHMNDLRADVDLPETQSVTTYTVYAFGDGDEGRNAMINTAMWGGFNDDDKNNAPYPFLDVNVTDKTSGTYNPFTLSYGNSKGFPSATTTFPIKECDPDPTKIWDAKCTEWDTKKTGLPYNFFEADDGDELKEKIEDAFSGMLGKASSSTAASVMGNNDNSGSTLLQAMYYPEKEFLEPDDTSTKASWIGELQAFWYYVDPSLNNITIREDSDNDRKLDLSKDRITEFNFVTVETKLDDGTKVQNQTVAKLYADANGDGIMDTPTAPSAVLDLTSAKSLWQAGKSLWARNLALDDRNIFTIDPSKSPATKLSFVSGNATNLYKYMDTSNDTIADAVIKYVRGKDIDTTYRNRTVTIGGISNVWKLGDIINSTPKLQSEVRLNSYNLRQPGGYSDTSYDQFTKSKDYNQRGAAYVGANDGMLHAFKLGSNFAGSTKGIVAEIKNADKTPATDLGRELWAFIPKNTLPYLKYLQEATYQHLYMVDATPLLVDASINQTKYSKDSTNIICTDATYSQCVKKTTVSPGTGQLSYDTTATNSGTSWRTLLLGSTGMGGAASPVRAVTTGIPITVDQTAKTFKRSSGSFATDGFAVGTIFAASGFTSPNNNSSGFTTSGTNTYYTVSSMTPTVLTCSAATGLANETSPNSARLQQITVKTPLMDPDDTAAPKTKGFGYSSVFALDVTDPAVPQPLWEFADPRLGFTTATPAVVRIKDAADNGSGPQRNGKWYAVYASGPSGPINNSWFLGITDKKLTIFVLDLKSGQLVRTFSSAAPSSTNTQFTLPVDAPAFAGSLSGATTDTDKYDTTIPEAYSDDAIYIGYTRANSSTAPTAWDKGGVVRLLTYNDPDPANWKISTLIDGVGPVTSAVTKLQDPTKTKSKLWIYFGTGRYYTKDDDPSNKQSLYGLKDPCFGTDNKFTNPCTATIGTSAAPKTSLDNQTTITTPDTSKSGWYIDLSLGDGTTTNSKRVITDTLASPNGVVTFTSFTPSKNVCSYGGETSVWAVKYDTGGSGASNLKGQLLMQLSTGAFEQVDISKAFTENEKRETKTFKGVPPPSPPAITANTNHFPTKRFLHIQER